MARNGSTVGRGVKVPSSRDLLDAAVARAAAAEGASVEAMRSAIMDRVRELRREDHEALVVRTARAALSKGAPGIALVRAVAAMHGTDDRVVERSRVEAEAGEALLGAIRRQAADEARARRAGRARPRREVPSIANPLGVGPAARGLWEHLVAQEAESQGVRRSRPLAR